MHRQTNDQALEVVISLNEQKIDSLEEYKGSLINVVVTGEVKVF
jgi:hypothetical protein